MQLMGFIILPSFVPLLSIRQALLCMPYLKEPCRLGFWNFIFGWNFIKAGVPVLVLLFVALWFILRGDLLYVFPCVILFLCFSVLLVFRLPRLGKRELILVLFVRLFGLCLFRFVGFLFLLGSWKGCGLWLRHSLDFSLTFFSQWKNSWPVFVSCPAGLFRAMSLWKKSELNFVSKISRKVL